MIHMDRARIVFPIRFATRSSIVQTTTRELSETGVLVRCLEPPAVGTILEMKLYLPGSAEGVEAEGVVREGMLARRERAAEAKPIGAISLRPRDDDPNRAFPRHDAHFAVRFATVQDFVLEYAANISAGGVFVHTPNPPPLKTVVRVEMELPGAGGMVPARAVVVHRVTQEEAKARGTLPGMGVQFVDADDKFRERIDTAIDHILKA
jgi:uncharacterized protein (TIGR02266 family)